MISYVGIGKQHRSKDLTMFVFGLISKRNKNKTETLRLLG